MKRANSNSSSHEQYYGVVKKGGPSGSGDVNSTMISNAVNTSVLSSQGLPMGPGGRNDLNVSASAALPNHIYQSTSVSSSKDLSLIQASLAKNFSKHF